MAEVTNEQKLYVLLKYKKERTKKEEKILSILNEKANLGSADLEEADKECCNQKWLSPIHVVEELGYTTKYSHRIELSESGESQIEKFWRESKYNPDNVWKSSCKIVFCNYGNNLVSIFPSVVMPINTKLSKKMMMFNNIFIYLMSSFISQSFKSL